MENVGEDNIAENFDMALDEAIDYLAEQFLEESSGSGGIVQVPQGT